MTTDVIELVSNDTGPQVNATLSFSYSGTAVTNISTCHLRMRLKNSTDTITNISGTVIDASNGKVVFVMTDFLSSRDQGDYEGEIRVNTSGGITISVFKKLQFFVRVKFA